MLPQLKRQCRAATPPESLPESLPATPPPSAAPAAPPAEGFDGRQGLGVAVERVHPGQPAVDLGILVDEAIVNGRARRSLRILLLCDCSGSMLARTAEGQSGARATGLFLKQLPQLLRDKVPSEQRHDCRVAIGFFASTAGWAGFDIRRERPQGSTFGLQQQDDAEEEPTPAAPF